jgi:hypothetical protein
MSEERSDDLYARLQVEDELASGLSRSSVTSESKDSASSSTHPAVARLQPKDICASSGISGASSLPEGGVSQ